MNVKIKRTHPNAVIPSYAKSGDAGMDLTAVSVKCDEKTSAITYNTGIAIEIPKGYVGLVFPRSSNCKKDLYLTNHVGVIDSSFRGSISLVFKPDFDHWSVAAHREEFISELKAGILIHHNTAENEHFNRGNKANIYAIGDRIGQLIIMPYPNIEFEEVEELSETDRGAGGYGSTGN